MNINRDNYESFFLLYTDNELPAADRKAVELFVNENTDLQQELFMLQQSIVQADKITFAFKNDLLKPAPVSASNEEKLLLYIDQELSSKEAKEVAALVIADSKLANELSLLKQTKLSADKDIVFPDKNVLYRREGHKIIPFGWWKLAVAAVFVGFGIWGIQWYVNQQSAISLTAVASGTFGSSKTPVKNTPLKKPADQAVVVSTPMPQVKENSFPKKVGEAVQISEQAAVTMAEKTLVKKEEKTKPDNHLPTPYFEKLNNQKSDQEAIVNVPLQTQVTRLTVNSNGDSKSITQPAAENNVYTASFSETNNDARQDQFTFSDDEPRKSKMGGLLRKAKRLLERSTKMTSGDNNIKVANLEFAIQ